MDKVCRVPVLFALLLGLVCGLSLVGMTQVSTFELSIEDYNPTTGWFVAVPKSSVVFMKYVPGPGQSQWPAMLQQIGKKVKDCYTSHRANPHPSEGYTLEIVCGEERFIMVGVGFRDKRYRRWVQDLE